MRIVFMGTPDFAVPTLEKLIESRHEVVAVYTKPDEIRGRDKTPSFTPVKKVALSHGIPVVQPKSLKWASRAAELAAFEPDVIVVVAYGLILRKNVLDIPKYCCINVHGSLLPKYRGAAPIQWTVLNGEETTGVTIMRMDEGLDTGDILKTVEIPVDPKETSGSLFDKLSVLGGEPLLEVLDEVERGEETRIPQGESPTAYASMLTKEMGELDFTMDAVTLERRIRAFSPWPSAYTFLDGRLLKILEAETEEAHDVPEGAVPGEIVSVTKQGFKVLTGEGLLVPVTVQAEGKKAMDTAAFLRGHALKTGEKLGRTEAKEQDGESGEV